MQVIGNSTEGSSDFIIVNPGLETAAMDVTPRGVGRTSKNGDLFPTDVAALLFGALIFVVSSFGLNRRFLSDPDTFWHLKTGEWMLAERAFPRHDVFSHTAFGQPWVNLEWLAQVILFAGYDLFGWRGLVLLGALVTALTFTLLYVLLARELRATVALGATAISFLFASNHFLARPHLLTFPIIVVWTAFLARASEEDRRPSLWLLPLMVLWANLHGGFTLGLFLVVGFGLEATIVARPSDRRRIAFRWLSFCTGAVLAGCITPYGYHYLLQTYHVFDMGALLPQIGEMRPMSPYTELKQEVILLCLLAMSLLFGVKIGIVRVAMIVGLLHLALQHVRGLALFALVLPFLVAHPLQQQFEFLRPSADAFPLFDRRRFRSPATIAALSAALVAIGLMGVTYAILRPLDAPAQQHAPAAALDYALKANLSGPVLNDYDFGGYLIFRGIPTFIDGRTLFFGKEFALHYFDATALGAGGKLEELADAYKVSWTLLRTGSAPALHFNHSPNWRRIYADDVAVIHVRR
jgi:hypothetical protein